MKLHTFHCVSDWDRSTAVMMRQGGYKEVTESAADIVIFSGGADVDPHLYGHGVHPTTGCDLRRDRYEVEVFARTHAKVRVGICRGGQFLNVMSGGKMFQDVNNHGGTHKCYYTDQRGETHEFSVTSTHHQMMMPDTTKSQLWGYADICTRKETDKERWVLQPGGSNWVVGPDSEIVWYPKTRALCFQPHPEYNNLDCRKLFFNCLDRVQLSI